MVGGAILGHCSIGSDTKPNTPRMTTRIEITVESTGRRKTEELGEAQGDLGKLKKAFGK